VAAVTWLSSTISLASGATIRKRVFGRFALDSGDIADLGHTILTLRVAAYEGRLNDFAAMFGLPANVTLTDSAILNAQLADARGVAAGVVHTHNQDLRSFLAQQPRTLSQAQLAAAVKDWESARKDWKGQQIALTEAMTARSQATKDVLSKNGITKGQRARVIPQDAQEEKCQELIDMGWVSIEEASGWDLPVHVGCCLEGTYVKPIGTLQAVSRVPWSGSAVKLYVSGVDVVITVTPNHPILTGRGWVPAEFVCIGDDVFCDDWMARTRLDFEDVPTRIEEYFHALSKPGEVFRAVPAAADFHGDGSGAEGEIEVVFADRTLMRYSAAGFAQQSSELSFERRDVRSQAFYRGGAPLALSERSNASAASGVGLLDVGGVGCGFTKRNIGSQQPTADGVWVQTQRSSDGISTLAGFITPHKVVHVEREFMAAHMYDLQTSSRVYSACSLIVHNCVHELDFDEHFASAVSDADSVWLGDWIDQ
jgi:hypothetical protein